MTDDSASFLANCAEDARSFVGIQARFFSFFFPLQVASSPVINTWLFLYSSARDAENPKKSHAADFLASLLLCSAHWNRVPFFFFFLIPFPS